MAQESQSNPNPAAGTDRQGPAGLYDFAIFLARSLGRALPAVVIIALVAWGAFYGVRQYYSVQNELSEKQKELSDAVIKKNDAEAAAKAAGATARNEALQKYSEQLEKQNSVLEKQNSVSTEVSKHVQELVAGQLENMKKMEESSRDQLGNLQAQIDDTQKKLNEATQKLADADRHATEVASLATYHDMLKDIERQNHKEFSFDSALIEKVDERLNDASIADNVKKDVANPEVPVAVRIVLLCELFKKTSLQQYRDGMLTLFESNKTAATIPVADLMIRQLGSAATSSNAKPIWVQWALDEGFPQEFRDSLMDSHRFVLDASLQSLSQDELRPLVRHVGKRLLETVATRYVSCNTVKTTVYELQSISPEAALVYAWKASSAKIGGFEETDAPCIKAELDKTVNNQRPTEDAIKRWLGSEGASVTASN